MPYKSVAAAKEAGFPTSVDGVPLSTIAQVNKLAEIYDAIEAEGGAEEPMAVAIEQWKKLYRQVDGGWVERKAEMADAPDQRYATPEPVVLARVGKWKGHDISVDRLKRLASNFAAMAKHGCLPKLTLGHDMKEFRAAKALGFRFVDGWPDLGSVVKCWYDEAKGALMGVLGDMPQKLADAINAGHYKDVSIVADYEYHDDVDGVERKDVLRYLGLLGVEWPGIKGMGNHLAAAAQTFSDENEGHYCMVLSDIEPAEDAHDGGGDNDMAENERLTELEKELKALKEQFEGTKSVMDVLLTKFEVEDASALPEAVEKWMAENEKLKAEAEEGRELKALKERAESEAAAKAKTEKIDAALKEVASTGKAAAGEVEALRTVMADMSDDPKAKLYTFADVDGSEVEGSQLDQMVAALKRRPRIPGLTMSDVAQASDANAHKGDDKVAEVDPLTRKSIEGMGYKVGPNGEAIEPDADK